MKQTIITCDICGKPTTPPSRVIHVYEHVGNSGHPYFYEDVCDDCLQKTSEFIRNNLVKQGTKYAGH